jgi:hypothetical protein
MSNVAKQTSSVQTSSHFSTKQNGVLLSTPFFIWSIFQVVAMGRFGPCSLELLP